MTIVLDLGQKRVSDPKTLDESTNKGGDLLSRIVSFLTGSARYSWTKLTQGRRHDPVPPENVSIRPNDREAGPDQVTYVAARETEMSASDELLLELADWVNAQRSDGRSEQALREALLRAGLAIPDGSPSFFPADVRILSQASSKRSFRGLSSHGEMN